jgi:hypothetical protein
MSNYHHHMDWSDSALRQIILKPKYDFVQVDEVANDDC